MGTPRSVGEGELLPLVELLGARDGPAERELLRRRLGRLGQSLRAQLGLREDAITVVEDAEESFVRIRGVAGTAMIGGRALDVRPKHVESPDDSTWQLVLSTMIDRSGPRRSHWSRHRRLALRPRTFVDQLAMSLAAELDEAQRHAEVRAYRSSRQELAQLRGRLLVTEQLRSSLVRPHRVVCEVDQLSSDNAVNRLLHWAAQELGSLSTDPTVRRALSAQAARLPLVSQPLNPPTQLSVHLPRQYQHYAGAVELALAFARGVGVAGGPGRAGGAGFLVGTEGLFESFLERSLEAALASEEAWSVSAQARSQFAVPATTLTPGRRAYFSKPDNVVRRDGRPVLLVDAKYKRFHDETDDTRSDRPGNGDLYQMAAACLAHSCERALLIYPRMTRHDLGPAWEPVWWQVDLAASRLHVGAVTVPLHELAERGIAHFDAQLRDLVERVSTPDVVDLAGAQS